MLFAGVACATAPTLRAQEPEPTDAEEIVVVGARLPRATQDVAATVGVISNDDLVATLASRTSDIVRYTPGVSVTEGGTRFGESDFTIRGLSGNRVLLLIDGIPVADQFAIGDFSNATQDYVVPDAISRVEILRGPASALFGSDALGGVVAVLTRDPAEFLGGEQSRVMTSASASSADASDVLSASAGLGGEKLAGLLQVARLDGHEMDHAAPGPTDDLNRTRESGLAKVTYALDGGGRLRLRVDGFDENVDSNLHSVLGYGQRYANTTSLTGNDERKRWTTAIGYDFGSEAPVVDAGRIDVYDGHTRVEQLTNELRMKAVPAVAIDREFDYEQDIWGVVGDFERRFATGDVEHRLGWGAAFDRRAVEESRNGLQTDLVTGGTTNVLLGESLPVRDFPKSTISELGVYAYDEISIAAVTLIPALRFDDYSMNARPDAMYRADNPVTTAVDVNETSLSPKLGLLYHATDAATLFMQYAHGFRAPPFADVNIGLDNPRFNYRAIPNPDLKSEKSDGLELGARFASARVHASASLYGADYDDFIESKVNLGPDPVTGVLIFQSQNVAKARIYGAEFDSDVDLDPYVHGVSIGAAGNWTRGENRDTHEPLNTVDPPEIVLHARWAARDSLALALMSTLVGGQHRVDESKGDLFQPGSFATVDVLATWKPIARVRIDAGVFNLFDETYWRWSAVRGRPEGDPMLGALSAPGRYGSVSLHVDL